MENKNIIQVKEAKIEEKIPESKQSANVLFKFMTDLKYLREILTNKAIIPRYYEESIEYLEVDELEKIVFPMVCFCDINVSRLSEHVEYYGKFGIGLNKEWGIKEGVQCINYINANSAIRNDFTHIFAKAYNENVEDNNLEEYNNYLLSNLLFMKPIVGEMFRNGKYDNKNFTDEKEWRYIPKIDDTDKIQLIIPPIYVGNPNVYNTY
ncbi:abortive infection system antitoxin AbiGi family protein [Clostridium uliginosum]|uniref:Putative abortive phage resistance protein AbiGi, antitoxin n=1 Tax=Clostridium uliginosum TaxID=119641 RepID=A0A1I1IZX3_9CLOT|nr:abortive infection system antitoxin AbiGi family protein [Clostridium uliginosum]SFC41814.1 Putative abortive phage resistance protein AbiGi, antitoxin [Clostridium uliginosum]